MSVQLTDLGSDISADCLTLPQYVERSYWDVGSSLLPGKEADIFKLVHLVSFDVAAKEQRRSLPGADGGGRTF
jgi:hypothetical protein